MTKIFEQQFFKSNELEIIGCDEVGRGPLAGPVVSCGTRFIGELKNFKKVEKKLRSLGVTDSKKLTDKKRRIILEELKIEVQNLKIGNVYKLEIEKNLLLFSLCEKDHSFIDKYNILNSSLEAMKEASLKLINTSSPIVLIDGNKKFKNFIYTQESIVKGDEKSVLIGLSSIIAKIYRDDLMINFAKKYPHYDFEKNAGYPTKKHREAIIAHGITPIHRKTFKGVSEFVAENKI